MLIFTNILIQKKGIFIIIFYSKKYFFNPRYSVTLMILGVPTKSSMIENMFIFIIIVIHHIKM